MPPKSTNNIWENITNFLDQRTAQIKLNSQVGNTIDIKSGVPQGSILYFYLPLEFQYQDREQVIFYWLITSHRSSYTHIKTDICLQVRRQEESNEWMNMSKNWKSRLMLTNSNWYQSLDTRSTQLRWMEL